ncbi:hypothetical protein GCM10029964_039100 [Kibdelosporangium lantanae]
MYQDTGPAPKLAVVAVGEPSYTHATSWVKEQPYLPADQLAVIQNFRNQGIPVVVLLVLPRPYVITEWKDLASAIVVTYRGGEEMGPAAASLLFGDYQAHGKLPWQPPRALRRAPARRHGRAGGRGGELGPAVRPGRHIGPADGDPAKIDAGQQVPTTYGNPLYPYGAGQEVVPEAGSPTGGPASGRRGTACPNS